MTETRSEPTDPRVEAIVDRILAHAKGDVAIAAPLGLGKPNHLLNAIYRRFKADPSRRLTIYTALSLDVPVPGSDLERRFLGPFLARQFGENYPRLDYVIGRLQLEPVLQQTIETLSKGFKRRVGLAQAIVHDPKVLILDEPTDGLDPMQKHEVRTLIGEIAREKTIVISTHILEEVDAVCTRAIIIARGKLVADDTPAGLKSRAPSGRLEDVFRSVAA